MKTLWKPNEIAMLRENYYKFSAEIIARKLGRSRNSIIAKANRLMKNGDLKAKKNARPIDIQMFKRPKVKKAIPEVNIKQVGFRNKKLSELGSRECRYPSGEGRKTTFCGCTVVEGKPYCAYHAQVAYQPKKEKVIT